ncbi:MAG TPA: methylated-DNA--[protein]-cysteine S-methyltransferase [Candidatus Limnocylindria bacterium]
MALSLGDVLPAEADARLIALRTTSIFCRPGCPAPAPMPRNVERYSTGRQALFAGYRPCLRCRPLDGARPAPTEAEVRRAERLRPILRAARETRRSLTGRNAAALRMLSTPLGSALAGATDQGICLLEFTDRPMLPTQLRVLAGRMRRPLLAGRHPLLEALQDQLDEYFAGQRAAFELPLVAPGSPFQERTWEALRRIPLGRTLSYEQLAVQAGRRGAQRAAGTANGANRIAVVVPCHRVIRKGGQLAGYGGGLWRKAWLLDHERRLAAKP